MASSSSTDGSASFFSLPDAAPGHTDCRQLSFSSWDICRHISKYSACFFARFLALLFSTRANQICSLSLGFFNHPSLGFSSKFCACWAKHAKVSASSLSCSLFFSSASKHDWQNPLRTLEFARVRTSSHCMQASA